MRFVEGVVTRNQPGQHAGIRCMYVAADQREANAGDRLHAEGFEHAHMTVAAADEHKVLEDRDRILFHAGLSLFDGCSEMEPCPDGAGERIDADVEQRRQQYQKQRAIRTNIGEGAVDIESQRRDAENAQNCGFP